tara:strand:- start:770 stop:904 length:135 start_codon:yes stop_codon:yes gene_type:complete
MWEVYFHLPDSIVILLYVMKNETGLPIRPGKNDEVAKFGLELNK